MESWQLVCESLYSVGSVHNFSVNYVHDENFEMQFAKAASTQLSICSRNCDDPGGKQEFRTG